MSGSRLERRTVLVTPVQGIVSALHEKLAPFEKASRKKGSNHAKNNFLRECPVHPRS